MTDRQRAFIPVWQEIRDATVRILGRYTIQSIADSVPEVMGEDFKPIYQI